MTTTQPAPRAAWPEGCSWPAPPAAARRRCRRPGRSAGLDQPTRCWGPWRTGHGLRRLAARRVRCRAPWVEHGQVGACPRASVRMLWTGASRCPQEPIARERPDAHGLHRRTGGQLKAPPGQQRTSCNSPVRGGAGRAGCHRPTGDRLKRSASGRGRSGTASRRTAWHRPQTNWRRSRQTAIGTGANGAAVPGAVQRLSRRRLGVGRGRASIAGR